MVQLLYSFLANDSGQDLIEYSLLIAFVALCSGALFLGTGGNIIGTWGTTNSQLVTANTNGS